MQKLTEAEMMTVNGGDIVCWYERTCPICGEQVARKWYIGQLTYNVAQYKAEAEYRNHLYEHCDSLL